MADGGGAETGKDPAGRAWRLPRTVSAQALLDGSGDDRFRQMVYDLLHLEMQMREARDRLAAAMGVSGPAYAILMTIGQQPGGIRVGDVAARLHVSGPFVTAEAGRLQQDGLVEKRVDPADRRAVLLHLSSEGRKRIDRLASGIRRVNDYFFGDLDRTEFDMLARIARRFGDKSVAALLEAFPAGI